MPIGIPGIKARTSPRARAMSRDSRLRQSTELETSKLRSAIVGVAALGSITCISSGIATNEDPNPAELWTNPPSAAARSMMARSFTWVGVSSAVLDEMQDSVKVGATVSGR